MADETKRIQAFVAGHIAALQGTGNEAAVRAAACDPAPGRWESARQPAGAMGRDARRAAGGVLQPGWNAHARRMGGLYRAYAFCAAPAGQRR